MPVARLALLLLLVGCGMEPFEAPRADGLKEGPGLFTGERGALVLTVPRPPQKEPATTDRDRSPE
jgi:hypothetical protein